MQWFYSKLYTNNSWSPHTVWFTAENINVSITNDYEDDHDDDDKFLRYSDHKNKMAGK